MRGKVAVGEELAKIQSNSDAFLASLVNLTGKK
jgi:hypothetical protein